MILHNSADVLADIERSHEAGYFSIPVFAFKSGGREWVVHGAAEIEEFERVLTEITNGVQ